MKKRALLIAIVLGSCLLFSRDSVSRASIFKTIDQLFTKKEREKFPLIIALSIKETFQRELYFSSFIEGMKLAERGVLAEREQPEMEAYAQYAMQMATYPDVQKNVRESIQYLRRKQVVEGLTALIEDKIYYKTIRKGDFDVMNNGKNSKLQINFSIKDISGNLIGENYFLAGPVSCELSELISGMATGMREMKLREIRQIAVHPELVYGVFSHFGEGKAVSITVELVGCEATDQQFSPCVLPVDLVRWINNDMRPINAASLQQAYMTFCGQTIWSFYRKKLLNIPLSEILKVLEAQNMANLTSENKEVLYKLQWWISTS